MYPMNGLPQSLKTMFKGLACAAGQDDDDWLAIIKGRRTAGSGHTTRRNSGDVAEGDDDAQGRKLVGARV